MKSGFVSIIGRPNVGKSTLLNTIVNCKVAITSNKAGTTRNLIQGIYNEKDLQIVFVDTPGINRPMNKLGKVLNKQSYTAMKDVDVILFVVDALAGLGKGDKMILDNLSKSEAPVILVLNKIDKLTNEELMFRINEYKDLFPFAEFVPTSALKNDNVDRLIQVIQKYLTDNIKYYDEDIVTNNSKYFMLSELVREKLMQKTIEEVPHSLTCHLINYEEKKNVINVFIDIIVDRDSIKKIVIGKQGERLKEIGILARQEMEEMLGKKVYLELYVKTIKNWKDREKYLSELGFMDFE
ncbi:MAG: GTPase Era [Bacilli bacterium]|nr:GTPase Era [Bacilli bacterium]